MSPTSDARAKQETPLEPMDILGKCAGPTYAWALLGIIHAAVLLTSIFFNCNVIPTVSYVFIAPLSPMLHQRIITAMGAMAHCGIVFWCEFIGGMRPFYSGDVDLLQRKYTSSKLVIANHQSMTDSIFLYLLAWRVGEIGHIRTFTKSSLKMWPALGVMWTYLNYIFLKRNFQDDAPRIKKQLETLIDKSKHGSTGNFWLMIYPEGARSRPSTIKQGQEYSKTRGLPAFNHSLVPRVKGLQVTLPTIHKAIDAVVDVTIGYTQRRPSDGKVLPSLEMLLFGGCRAYEVHAHVRVIPAADVPTDPDHIHNWTMKLFAEKNALLTQFKSTGSFPDRLGPTDSVAPVQVTAFTCAANLLTFAGLAATVAVSMWYIFILAYCQLSVAIGTASAKR
eukprot:1189378-Rhodomonas_salina.1